MKTIGITGGTGFVGKHLSTLLLSKGYKVIVFSRSIGHKNDGLNTIHAHWDIKKKTCDINALKELDAVVHLAGAGVADKRWTEARKKEIINSRINGTDFLIEQLIAYAPQCKTLIAASATGYYGPDDAGKPPFTETAPPNHDFLSKTCVEWEDASHKADTFLRTAILRLGIVLGKESGAYAEFAGPMKFGVVPILGDGKQVVSWIEVNDLARLILYGIENEQLAGTYNAVAPQPVSHKQLMKTIARVKGGIKIPVPVPAFALKIALGELSTEVLKSCTVSADKTVASGFKFDHPEIEGAVRHIESKD